jgi:hypothetical protein
LVGTDLVKHLQKTVFDLRDKTVAEFEVNEINKLELIRSDTTIVCVQDTSGSWQLTQPVELKAKDSKVSGILWDIKGLKAQQILTEKPRGFSKYGLDKPQIMARLWKDETVVGELLVGKEKDGSVYVKTKQTPTIFIVKDDIVKDLWVKVEDIDEVTAESIK